MSGLWAAFGHKTASHDHNVSFEVRSVAKAGVSAPIIRRFVRLSGAIETKKPIIGAQIPDKVRF